MLFDFSKLFSLLGLLLLLGLAAPDDVLHPVEGGAVDLLLTLAAAPQRRVDTQLVLHQAAVRDVGAQPHAALGRVHHGAEVILQGILTGNTDPGVPPCVQLLHVRQQQPPDAEHGVIVDEVYEPGGQLTLDDPLVLQLLVSLLAQLHGEQLVPELPQPQSDLAVLRLLFMSFEVHMSQVIAGYRNS